MGSGLVQRHRCFLPEDPSTDLQSAGRRVTARTESCGWDLEFVVGPHGPAEVGELRRWSAKAVGLPDTWALELEMVDDGGTPSLTVLAEGGPQVVQQLRARWVLREACPTA